MSHWNAEHILNLLSFQLTLASSGAPIRAWLDELEVGAEVRVQLANSATIPTREEACEVLRSWVFAQQESIGESFRVEQLWGFLSPLLQREERDLPSHDDLMALQAPIQASAAGLLDDDAPAPLPSFGHTARLLAPSDAPQENESKFQWSEGATQYNAWEGLLGDAGDDEIGSVVPPSMALFDELDEHGDPSLLDAAVSSPLLDEDPAPPGPMSGAAVPLTPAPPSSVPLRAPPSSVPLTGGPMTSAPLASLGSPTSKPPSTKETQVAAAIPVRGDLAEAFGIPVDVHPAKEESPAWVDESSSGAAPDDLVAPSVFTPESLAPIPPPPPRDSALGPATQMELDAAFGVAFGEEDPAPVSGESYAAPASGEALVPPMPAVAGPVQTADVSAFSGGGLFSDLDLPDAPEQGSAPVAVEPFHVAEPTLHPMTPSSADLDVVVGAPMVVSPGPEPEPSAPLKQAAPLMLKKPVGGSVRTPKSAPMYIKGPSSETSPHSDPRVERSPNIRHVPTLLRMEDTGSIQLSDDLVAAFEKKPSAAAQFVRIGLILLGALVLIGGALGLYFHFR